MSTKKVYECRNADCTLGSVGEPGGRFTDGATKEWRTMLTGDPDPPKDSYGPGVCPNCGKRGKETK